MINTKVWVWLAIVCGFLSVFIVAALPVYITILVFARQRMVQDGYKWHSKFLLTSAMVITIALLPAILFPNLVAIEFVQYFLIGLVITHFGMVVYALAFSEKMVIKPQP